MIAYKNIFSSFWAVAGDYFMSMIVVAFTALLILGIWEIIKTVLKGREY